MITGGKLSRYILARFVVAVFGVLCVCMALVFLVDVVEMVRRAGKFGGAPLLSVVWLTVLRLPTFAEFILPFAVLIGSIATFLMLSKSSELVVARSIGMSVWQFVAPGLALALALGVFAVTVYNPLATATKAQSERLYAELFKRGSSLLRTKSAGAWLRQDGQDGPSVIHAAAVTDQGMSLTQVVVIQFDRDLKFLERIDAARARLKVGRWELDDARVSAVGREPQAYESYLVSTFLSPTQVRDSFASATAISFWKLPEFIAIAEKAGLPAERFKLQYQTLLARPLLLCVMVLLAATFSLRIFRLGNIRTLAIGGLTAGLVFFILVQVSRQFASSGMVSAQAAAWTPIIIAILLSTTVLLYQEDG